MRFIPRLLTLTLMAILAACGKSGGISATGTPLPSATLEPTSTPVPALVLVTPADAQSAADRAAVGFLEKFAADNGLALSRIDPGVEAVRQAADSSPVLIVAVDSGLGAELNAFAADRPGLRFATVGEAGVSPAPNLLVIGSAERGEEAAFLAGLLAAIDNQNDIVGWVGEAGTVRGALYQNGFHHGVRYFCPMCQIFDYELAAAAGEADGVGAADELAARYADTASAIPGPAGDAGLRRMSQYKIRVAGAGPDLYAGLFGGGSGDGAANVLGGIAYRPDVLLADLLPRFLGGETFPQAVPYSVENGGLAFDAFPNDWVSIGRRNLLQEVVADLASGELDTGVDPATGQDR